MKLIDTVAAGLMMMGLVLGALTGAIAMLIIPVIVGLIIMGAVSWYRHIRNHSTISFSNYYPPYGY